MCDVTSVMKYCACATAMRDMSKISVNNVSVPSCISLQ